MAGWQNAALCVLFVFCFMLVEFGLTLASRIRPGIDHVTAA